MLELISLALFAASLCSSHALDCPSHDVVSPCLCSSDGKFKIRCSGLYSNDITGTVLRTVLENVKRFQATQGITPEIEVLEIGSTKVTTIDRDMLAGIPLQELWLRDNMYLCLDDITVDAFADSKETLRVFKATVEAFSHSTKYHDHDGSVLNRFQGFKHLEVLDFMNYNMTKIPGHYLCTFELPALREIWMNLNGIEVIEDLAFHNQNLTHLSLMKNRIKKIYRKTFSFEQPSALPLRLNLWDNGLTDASFEAGSFSDLKRPVFLDLYENKLKTLSEAVFRDIVDNPAGGVSVDGNPIHCDCKMKWLFETKGYIERVDGVFCINFNRPIEQLEESDFEVCSLKEKPSDATALSRRSFWDIIYLLSSAFCIMYSASYFFGSN